MPGKDTCIPHSTPPFSTTAHNHRPALPRWPFAPLFQTAGRADKQSRPLKHHRRVRGTAVVQRGGQQEETGAGEARSGKVGVGFWRSTLGLWPPTPGVGERG